MSKSGLILVLILALFATSSNAQTGEESEKGMKLFSVADPISSILVQTFFLPLEAVSTEEVTRPVLTAEESRLYNTEEIPITMERNITLLIEKRNDRVSYLWSQKDRQWIEPDREIYAYLQNKYENRDELREEVNKRRRLISLQKSLSEMHNNRLVLKSDSRSAP